MTDDARMTRESIDPRYVAARRVLLDALTALAAQSDAVIVAGAQAIYLRTGGGDVTIAPVTFDDLSITVAPFTTDADLALDPARLERGPDPGSCDERRWVRSQGAGRRQTSSAREVGANLAALCANEIAGAVSTSAVIYLDELFGRRGRPGVQMAARALRLGMPEERVEALAVAYTAAVLAAVREASRKP